MSQILLKEIEFPIGILVTVTGAETSPDLKDANIWISAFPKEESGRVLEILNKNIYFLQQKLNKRLKMRPLPRIKFLEERKTAEAGEIEKILEELKKEEKRDNI